MSVEGKIVPGAEPSAETPSQPSLTRRHLLMGGALLAVSGLAIARAPKRRVPDLTNKQYEALFPKSFGDWHILPSSELVLPPESELANKLYQHILTRTYVNSAGVSVMFLAAYNSIQLNNVQLHRPEVCYYASGFAINVSKPVDINVGAPFPVPARNVVAKLGSRNENILYWTRVGSEFPQSQPLQRVSMTKANLEGYLPDGLLLRMSVVNPDTDLSYQQMNGFIRDLVKDSGPATRRLLIGTA